MGNLTQSNLVSLTTQLKPGQRCIKIGNSIVPVGVGGITAGGSSAGTPMNFYKCASVIAATTTSGYIVSGSGNENVDGGYTYLKYDESELPVNIYVHTGKDFNTYYYIRSDLGGAYINTTLDEWWSDCLFQQSEEQGENGYTYVWRNSSNDIVQGMSATQGQIKTGQDTWTGYKAVLNNGSYSFQSDSTSGLTYGSGYTPEVGYVYSQDTLIKASLYSSN